MILLNIRQLSVQLKRSQKVKYKGKISPLTLKQTTQCEDNIIFS